MGKFDKRIVSIWGSRVVNGWLEKWIGMEKSGGGRVKGVV